jgi:hypothetical protein
MAVVMQAMGQLQRHIAHRIVLQTLGGDAQPSTDSRLSKCHRCGDAFHTALLSFLSLMQSHSTGTLGAGC